MWGTMVVETLDYQNQGNVENAGWCRPKEREAEGIIASRMEPALDTACVEWAA